MENISSNFEQVKQRINNACIIANRKDTVHLLAVSKRQPVEKVITLYKLGQQHFGESYLQEAEEKIKALKQYPIQWHFIGPIQSNKTRPIANLFDWIHSVDRLKIARRINEQRSKEKTVVNICLQININNEKQKSGFSLVEIEQVVEQIITLKQLKLRGLMAIPMKTNDLSIQRQNFSQLRKTLEQLNKKFAIHMDTLSMGMSNDLEAAVCEGATIVRVGTALFGSR